MRPQQRKEFIARRHKRLRKKVRGTSARPRLAVAFTGKNIYAQVVDDVAGKTLAFASTLDKGLRDKKLKGNKDGAIAVGKLIAERAKEKGVSAVVFDRGGFRYEVSEKGKNRLAALADAAREVGLKF